MRLPIRIIVATLVALGCGETNAPAPVRITGSWDGTIDLTSIGQTSCPLNQSITENNSSDVTGTADLGAPCAVVPFTVTGTNNADGVADSVELTFTAAGGTLTFNGNHDRNGVMMGVISGEGCTTCATTFTRTSTTP